MPEFIFTMKGLRRVVPPKREILKDSRLQEEDALLKRFREEGLQDLPHPKRESYY